MSLPGKTSTESSDSDQGGDSDPADASSEVPSDGDSGDTSISEDLSCELATEVRAWDLKDSTLVALTVLAIFYTLYFTRALLFPIVLAFILNLVLKPIILRLAKFRIPPAVSAAIVMVLGTAIVAFGVMLLWNPASRWISEARTRMPVALQKLKNLKEPVKQITEMSKELEKVTEVEGDGEDENEKPVPVKTVEDRLSSAINLTGGFLGSTMVVIVLLYFLLAGGDRFLEKTVELMPSWRDKRRVVALSREIQNQISSYLFSITLINIGLGIVIGTGLYFLGMPEPVLWGTMAALLNYIPFAGALVGATIVFAVGVISLPTLAAASLAPTVYLTANAIEANFITPAILGKAISLNPVILILSIFFWGWLWGIGGVLLAVPLLVVLKIWFDHSTTLKPLGVFLGR